MHEQARTAPQGADAKHRSSGPGHAEALHQRYARQLHLCITTVFAIRSVFLQEGTIESIKLTSG